MDIYPDGDTWPWQGRGRGHLDPDGELYITTSGGLTSERTSNNSWNLDDEGAWEFLLDDPYDTEAWELRAWEEAWEEDNTPEREHEYEERDDLTYDKSTVIKSTAEISSYDNTPERHFIPQITETSLQQTWVKLNGYRIVSLLDEVIYRTGKNYFDKLAKDLSPYEITANTEYAFDQLNLLQEQGIPNYKDEWVALYYYLWYHPMQVNLAYNSIRLMTNPEKSNFSIGDYLYVVDYACGALAMQFGIVLAVADKIHNGENVHKVKVDCVDKSEPLISLGEDSWKIFCELVASKGNSVLKEAISKIDHQTHSGIKADTFKPYQINPYAKSDIWFSILHGVYREEVWKIKSKFRNWLEEYYIQLCIISSQNHKRHLVDNFLVDNLLLSLGKTTGLQPKYGIGHLEQTTNLLSNHIKKKLSQNTNVPLLKRLTNPVTFNPIQDNSEPYIRILKTLAFSEQQIDEKLTRIAKGSPLNLSTDRRSNKRPGTTS